MRYKSAILILSLLLNIAFAGAIVYKRFYNKIPVIDYKQVRADIVNSLPSVDSTSIVFIGDSRLEQFPAADFFPGHNIANRGIWGNTTQEVFTRLPNIVKKHPKKLFLNAGVNDIIKGYSPNDVYQNIIKTIQFIKQQSPTTDIYVISPVGTDNVKIAPLINILNQKLYNGCKENSITFIDVNTPLTQNSVLIRQNTYDGIHFTVTANDIIRDSILHYIN